MFLHILFFRSLVARAGVPRVCARSRTVRTVSVLSAGLLPHTNHYLAKVISTDTRFSFAASACAISPAAIVYPRGFSVNWFDDHLAVPTTSAPTRIGLEGEDKALGLRS